MKQNISFETFTSLDMRVGTIVKAQVFPEARKPAYQIWVDFGPLGILKSSAQITIRYNPEELINRQVVAAVNLGDRQIGPFRSQCLILGVPGTDGDVVLLQPEQTVPNGSSIA